MAITIAKHKVLSGGAAVAAPDDLTITGSNESTNLLPETVVEGATVEPSTVAPNKGVGPTGPSAPNAPPASAPHKAKKKRGHAKQKQGHAKPLPLPNELNELRRLRVGHLMSLLACSHASVYARLATKSLPPPDGKDGRRPFWKASTIRTFLDTGKTQGGQS